MATEKIMGCPTEHHPPDTSIEPNPSKPEMNNKKRRCRRKAHPKPEDSPPIPPKEPEVSFPKTWLSSKQPEHNKKQPHSTTPCGSAHPTLRSFQRRFPAHSSNHKPTAANYCSTYASLCSESTDENLANPAKNTATAAPATAAPAPPVPSSTDAVRTLKETPANPAMSTATATPIILYV